MMSTFMRQLRELAQTLGSTIIVSRVTRTPTCFSSYLGDQRDISSCAVQSQFRVCINCQKACFGTFVYVYDRLHSVVTEDARRT